VYGTSICPGTLPHSEDRPSTARLGLGLGLYRSGATPSPEVGLAHRHSAAILTPT
jgi:hypothetical protein